MMESTLWLGLVIAFTFASTSMFGWLVLTSGREFWRQYKATFEDSASTNMADMFMFVDPERLFRLNVLAIVVLPLLLWILTGDALIAVSVLVALIVLPIYAYRVMRKRRLAAFEKQLPDALIMVAGSLQSGASLTMALESLAREQPAPISQEFQLFLREQRLGVEFETALEHMEQRLPIPDFHLLSSALRISREIGGNLAEILDSLAGTLRRKATMEGKIESLTAQGKMQGIVMTGLPVLLAALLMYLEPEAMSKLFTTPIGWLTLLVVVAMEFLGYLFIRKIVTIEV